jgi:methionyl-tRNA formyltransferase
MKILFCLNRDIYCHNILNHFLKTIENDEIKIYFSNGVGITPDFADLNLLKFYEQVLPFNKIFPLLEKTFQAEKKLDEQSFLTFDQISKIHSLEILNFQNINKDGLEYLKLWQPDLIISVRFGQIFKGEIINLPKYGIINLHSGILPDYRGIMATFWTMLEEKKQIGSTLHFISDASIDTGDIISVSNLNVDPSKSLIWHINSLYKNGGIQMIDSAIKNFKNNIPINTMKPDLSKSGYFSYPQESDFEKFKKNYKIFDPFDYYEEVLDL